MKNRWFVPFDVGAIVYAPAYGLTMAVKRLIDSSHVLCCWFDGNEYRETSVLANELEEAVVG